LFFGVVGAFVGVVFVGVGVFFLFFFLPVLFVPLWLQRPGNSRTLFVWVAFFLLVQQPVLVFVVE